MPNASPLMPIEEGCLAMVIDKHDEENHGKIVTVGKFLGTNYVFNRILRNIAGQPTVQSVVEGRVWEISEPIAYVPRRDGGFFSSLALKDYFPFCPEQNLMRIDGWKEEESTHSRKELEAV